MEKCGSASPEGVGVLDYGLSQQRVGLAGQRRVYVMEEDVTEVVSGFIDPNSLASDAVYDLLKHGVTAACRGLRQTREGPAVSLVASSIADAQGRVVAHVPDSESETLQATLRSERARSFVQTYCMVRLLASAQGRADQVLEQLESDFTTFVSNEGGVQSWATLGSSLWRGLTAEMDFLLPLDELATSLAGDGVALMNAATTTRVSAVKQQQVVLPAYLQTILDLTRSDSRSLEAATAATRIKQAVNHAYSEMRLQHTLDDQRRSMGGLYVARDLRAADDGRVSPTAEVFTSAVSGRAVITGPPGVGKSTLTSYLTHKASEEAGFASVPLLLRAREYKVDYASGSILSALTQTLTRDLQLYGIDEAVLVDLLSLGRCFVVFDGLDEILAPQARKDFIGRIEAFVRQYPLNSYLVTSRDIGYEQARMSPGLFTRYRLSPFSDAQVREYAYKWFSPARDASAARRDGDASELGPVGGSELVERFLIDVDTIPDLKSNPLMLSLLCTLYTARGHIPRNRREVYAQCADLLFNRWDSHRQIAQPTDYMQHGQELMQEIAWWYFRSSTAQRGLQRQVIEQVVAQFFEDDAGVFPAEARARARDFLSFCSSRAWLLGKGGGDGVQQVFVFTHRTFMEFFAAEALSRRNDDLATVADHVVTRYQADTSSVLPELIAQAVTYHRGRGAGRMLLSKVGDAERSVGVKGEGRYLALRLRLIAVMAAPAETTDGLLSEALMALGDTARAPEVFTALVQLPRDARARLEALLGSRAQAGVMTVDTGLQANFVAGWAYLALLGEQGPFVEEWEDVVLSLTHSAAVVDALADRMAVRHWLVEQGYVPRGEVMAGDIRPVVAVGDQSLVLGVCINGVARALVSESRAADEQIIEAIRAKRMSSLVMTEDEAQALELLTAGGGWLVQPAKTPDVENAGEAAGSVLLALACAVWEVRGDVDNHALLTLAGRLPGVDLSRLFACRRDNGDDVSVRPLKARELSEVISRYGSWVGAWTRRTKHFVKVLR